MGKGLKTRQVTVVDHDDWNSLVRSVYNRPYDIQQQDGCLPQGTHVPVSIDVDSPPYDDFEGQVVPYIVNGSKMGVDFEIWKATDPNSIVTIDKYSGLPEPNQRWFNIEILFERNFYPAVDRLAYDLYMKGHITETDFEIECSW